MKDPRARQAPVPAFLPRAAALAALAGCAAPAYDEADAAYYRNDPRSLEEAYKEAVNDTGKNALLGIEKLLSAALLRGDWVQAEKLAIHASRLVNIFVAGEPGERDALSFLGQEKDKPFKGEPHERVMVDYYLGVLRFRAADYEGALAAFRSAILKDRGSFLLPVDKGEARKESENARRYLYDSDYALLEFLAAKCCQLLSEPEDAEKHLARAKTLRQDIEWLFTEGMAPETNVLVLVEAGQAPRKRKTGPEGAILAYEPGAGWDIDEIEVTVDGKRISHGQCDDLLVQATTLGGRGVDDLNLVKAKRQEALRIAGFATTMAGYTMAAMGASSHSRALETAGLIAMAVGIGTMIFTEVAIDPSADVRAWTTLPQRLFLATGRAEPGTTITLGVRTRGAQDESQEWTAVPVEEGTNLYWLRLLPGRKGGPWPAPGVPGGPPAGAPAAAEGGGTARYQAFPEAAPAADSRLLTGNPERRTS